VGLFSTNFRTALLAYGSSPPPLFTVLDVVWNGVGTKRYTDDALAYGTVGAEPRIEAGQIDSIRSSVSQRVGDLGRQTHRVSLIDTDRTISTWLMRYDMRRVPVTFRWGLPGVAEADWFVAFTGILTDWSASSGTVELSTSTNDRILRGTVPSRSILKGWAPKAPQSSLGVYLPVVLGVHDGQGLLTSGMIPLIPYCLDASAGYWYVVSLGYLKAVTRVYNASSPTPLSVGTGANNYTVYNIALGGLFLTVIRIFSPSPVLTEADSITADVEGLTNVYNGTGSVISNPVEQFQWMLQNLIYSDWNGGAYATTAPVDETLCSIAASYATAFKQEGSQYIGGTRSQTSGNALISSWLKSHLMMRARWSNLGELGVFPLDHRYAPYTTDYVFTGEEFGTFSYQTASEGLATMIESSYLYSAASGQYWMSLQVQDLERWLLEKITESYDLSWSGSRFA